MTRSKELVDSLYRLGMGISYSNVFLLRDVWTMHDLKRCSVCPVEIAEEKPSISIIDNDAFLNDTLTGGGPHTTVSAVCTASENWSTGK